MRDGRDYHSPARVILSSMNLLRCAVLALSLCTVAAAAQDPNRFENAAARFSLTKPAGWSFVAAEGLMTAEDWQQVDGALRKKVESAGTIPRPLVTMVSDVSSNEALTVFVMPLAPARTKESPTKILEGSLAEVKKLLSDVTLEVPIRKRELSGRPAAEYVATYAVPLKDGPVRMRSRSIVVPRGNVVFLIATVAPVESGDRVSEEFAKIVSSITIGD
jgi:hypothetical protein